MSKLTKIINLFLLTASVFASGTEVHWGVKIPARDGVKLSSNIYFPKTKGKAATILCITPYTVEGSIHEEGKYFADHGFVFVAVDVRGRGNSEGEFVPFRDDGRDGYDIVEWIAAQDWSDGHVGMTGASYSGYNQWAVAKEAPPHLRAIAPAGAAYPGVDFPYYKNIPNWFSVYWCGVVMGKCGNRSFMKDDSLWNDFIEKAQKERIPFAEIDKFCNFDIPFWKTWISHPTLDSYWKSAAPYGDDFSSIKIPVLSMTGQYDDDQPGTLAYHRRLVAHGGNGYLLIGPWDHTGMFDGTESYDGVAFGEQAKVDANELLASWFRWTLSGGVMPQLFEGGAFHYYSLVANQWKTRKTFVDTKGGTSYLSASGKLSNTVSDGVVGDFSFDPSFEQSETDINKKYTKDRLVGNGDHLIYAGTDCVMPNFGAAFTGTPIKEAITLTGSFHVSLRLSLDASDADLYTCVFEIQPNGTWIQLASDYLRLRYRMGLDKAVPMIPGKPADVSFDGFNFISKRFPVGTRFAVCVGPLKALHAQRNYGTSIDPSHQVPESGKIIHVQILGGKATSLTMPGLDNE